MYMFVYYSYINMFVLDWPVFYLLIQNWNCFAETMQA